MKINTLLCNFILLSVSSNALPTQEAKSIRTDSKIDGDDAVVYTWSRPEEAVKRSPKELDGDDQVVYTWSRPDEHRKRWEKDIDGDDQVVYTWSRPEEDNTE